jgi:hypothetical protein
MGFLRKKPNAAQTVSARAYVLDVHESRLLRGMSASDPYQQASGKSEHTKFQLRITPPDGGLEFESEASVWGEAGLLRSGRMTYVRYAPDDPSHCDIDIDRLAKEFGPKDEGKRRMTMPSDRARRRGSESSSGPRIENRSGVNLPFLPQPATASDGLTTELSRLAELHASGGLTDAEFAAAKSQILARGEPG